MDDTLRNFRSLERPPNAIFPASALQCLRDLYQYFPRPSEPKVPDPAPYTRIRFPQHGALSSVPHCGSETTSFWRKMFGNPVLVTPRRELCPCSPIAFLWGDSFPTSTLQKLRNLQRDDASFPSICFPQTVGLFQFSYFLRSPPSPFPSHPFLPDPAECLSIGNIAIQLSFFLLEKDSSARAESPFLHATIPPWSLRLTDFDSSRPRRSS